MREAGTTPAGSFEDYIARLEARLAEPLPGLPAQRRMAPEGRSPERYDPTPEHARQGAVLVLLYRHEGRIVMPFIRRPEDDTPHAGQIAFPGGKRDTCDADLGACALREAEEEIGLPRNRV
ncbi:MAG: NUDIX hydrolase, partial [Spirochaetota bacterium]